MNVVGSYLLFYSIQNIISTMYNYIIYTIIDILMAGVAVSAMFAIIYIVLCTVRLYIIGKNAKIAFVIMIPVVIAISLFLIELNIAYEFTSGIELKLWYYRYVTTLKDAIITFGVHRVLPSIVAFIAISCYWCSVRDKFLRFVLLGASAFSLYIIVAYIIIGILFASM